MSVAVTQCPHCSAKFRVRDEHVRAHSGLVRCGACRGIFDARLNLVEGQLSDPNEDADTFGSPNTIMQGLPAVPHAPTSEEVQAAARAAVARRDDASDKPKKTEGDEAATASTAKIAKGASAANDSRQGERTATSDENYDWRAPDKPLSFGQKLAFFAFSIVALFVLVAQTLYWFRDEVAVRYPSLAQPLAKACEHIGCKILPPRKSESLGFVGSELAADPAHRGLHVFSATLRNSSDTAVSLPSLILTLDGVGGALLARKVFSPEQYAPANVSLQRGIEAGADLEIKLYLDVSPATPIGFKADHAYL